MEYGLFEKLWIADFNIDHVFANKQEWNYSRVHRQTEHRPRYGLLLITDYPVQYTFHDGTKHTFAAGDVVMLPKGSCYTTKVLVPKGKTAHPILISFQLQNCGETEIHLPDTVFRIPYEGSSLFPLFDAACSYYMETSNMMLKATVYTILAELFSCRRQDPFGIRYIHSNYTKHLSVEELATKCAMSETTYRKGFKQLTGQSPLSYINQMKIEKACEMLKSSDMKLCEISDYLSFYSPQYFCRIFKEHKGMTAKQYRANANEKNRETD